jgi:surface protein
MNSRNNNSKDKEMKQTKSNLVLEKIKSDYFLMKLLDIMKKNRMFEIVKYNKKLQKRLNLSINDYKEYFNEYTSIEIELRVKNDRYYEEKFINIPYRNEKHCHIYFDNSSEEIHRNYLEKDEKVETIKIIIDNPITSFRRLFYECDFVVSVFFKKFNRKNITDMSDMFRFGPISYIEKLDLTNFKTDNVKNMSGMFSGCFSLK